MFESTFGGSTSGETSIKSNQQINGTAGKDSSSIIAPYANYTLPRLEKPLKIRIIYKGTPLIPSCAFKNRFSHSLSVLIL